MELNYLNGLLEDVEQDECYDINGGGIGSIIVGVVVGGILVIGSTTTVHAPTTGC